MIVYSHKSNTFHVFLLSKNECYPSDALRYVYSPKRRIVTTAFFYTASQCESIAESTDQTTPIKQRETGMPQFLHCELQNFFNLLRRIGCGESANETK